LHLVVIGGDEALGTVDSLIAMSCHDGGALEELPG
jgi:hypothetical protein